MYGGRCVTILKTGTDMIANRPTTKILRLYLFLISLSGFFNVIFPLNTGNNDATPEETTIHTIEGISKWEINSSVVTFSPIQSIVVVTSPIGDHAPPAFAAITINPAYHNLSDLFGTNFWRIEISTIVAVRLSMIADKTNASIEKTHRIAILLLNFIKSLITAKPLKWSIISTIVIAPIRKISISEVLAKWCNKVFSKKCCFSSIEKSKNPSINPCVLGSNQLEKPSIPKAMVAHKIVIVIRAGTSLSTFITCSIVMAKYPRINMLIINNSI